MGNKTILIVDDDANVLKILERILIAAGYSVLKAQNGKDGISVAKDRKPDLVLLDITMPDMSGDYACEILSADPNTQDIPVGFVTGLVTKKEAGRKNTGRYFYVAKPIDAQELLQKIKENLT